MADNVLITPGAGDTIAADDVGGVKLQRVKLVLGADGVNDGDVAATNPVPVTGTLTGITGSVAVHFDGSEPTVKVKQTGTLAVALDPGYTLGYIAGTKSTLAVVLDPGYELGSIKGINSTVAVYFDPSNPAVAVTFPGTIATYFDQSEPTIKVKQTGTLNVALDPGHTLGYIAGIRETVAVYFDPANPAVAVTLPGTLAVYYDQSEPTVKIKQTGTLAVALDPGYTLGSIQGINSSVAVYFDGSEPTVKVKQTGTLNVQLDPGHSLGTIEGINRTVAVYFDPANPAVNATLGGTMAVYFDQSEPTVKIKQTGTLAVYFDPAGPSVSASFNPTSTLAVNLGTTEGTITVRTDPGHTLGSIERINQTVAVYFDPSNPAVSATFSPASTLAVRVGQVDEFVRVSGIRDTVAVYFDPANPSVNATFNPSGTLAVRVGQVDDYVRVSNIRDTVAVYFDPANPAVQATFPATTLNVQLDPGHTLGYIAGTKSSLGVYLDAINQTVRVNLGTTEGTITVRLDPGNELGSIKGINSTVNVALDPGHTLGKVLIVDATGADMDLFKSGDNAAVGADHGLAILALTSETPSKYRFLRVGSGVSDYALRTVHATDVGASVKIIGQSSTLSVEFDPGHTLGKVEQGSGGTSAWLTNAQHTASIFTVSGTYEGVSDLGVTLCAPSASYNFKVFAYSLQTTGQVSTVCRFTNGAGSATELWRGIVTASGVTGVQGANLAVSPPGYLFATGTNVTLALHTGNASLFHYSVSYIKESA